MLRRIGQGITLFGFALFVLSIGWALLYKWVNPPVSNLMLLRWIQSRGQLSPYNLRQQWFTLSEMTPYASPVAIVAEDPNFYSHRGVELTNICKAFKASWKKLETPGYSTITQQTVKNLFLYPKKQYLRKALEIYLAIIVDCLWGKERILEVYLNIAEFGPAIYGLPTAAATFFSKNVKDLDLHETCNLMAVLPNPRLYHPVRLQGSARKRAHFLMYKSLSLYHDRTVSLKRR